MKRVAPGICLAVEPLQFGVLQHTIRLRGPSGGDEETDTAISAKSVLRNSASIRVVWGIVAMESLGSGAGSDAEDDGVVELGSTNALFVLVTHLETVS